MRRMIFCFVIAVAVVILSAFGVTGQTNYTGGKEISVMGVHTALSATTIPACDSLDVDLGDISTYWEIYIKCNATTWVDDVVVRVGSSEDSTWASGNTTYFDRNPATVIVEYWGLSSALTTEGTCIPLMNTYGAYLPGPYGILRIVNGSGSSLVGLEIILIKRK